MHYEQHIQKINTIFENPTSSTVGKAATDLRDLGNEANEILKRINERRGKIVSVTPITKGYFDRNHDYNYDNDDIYSWGYGWGTSFTRALLYIVEYPD